MMRIDIKSWTSSIVALFGLLASELPSLEGPIDFGKCCPDNSNFIFDLILIRLAGIEDNHKILDKLDFGED